MTKSKLEKLIEAAAADGEISKEERSIILREGLNNGFSEKEVEVLINAAIYRVEQKTGKKKEESSCLGRILNYFIIFLILSGLLCLVGLCS